MLKSKKSIILTAIFISFFILQILALSLVLIISANPAQAALPRADYDDCEGKSVRSTRLYIPIPGITDQCGYVKDINQDQEGNIIDYLIGGYRFLIGVAAILAVVMIMYGGYKWMFAAGNPSRITDAKDTIISACIGLVLALLSVTILETINPRLTQMEMPKIQSVQRITQDNWFCGASDILFDINKWINVDGASPDLEKIPTNLKDSNLIWGDENKVQCDGFPKIKVASIISVTENQKTKNKELIIDCYHDLCYEKNKEGKYEIDKQGKKIKKEANIQKIEAVIKDSNRYGNNYIIKEIIPTESLKISSTGGGCYGNWCDPMSNRTLCLPNKNKLECLSPRNYCLKLKANQCEAFNEQLRNTNQTAKTHGYLCKRRDDGIDNCEWGQPLFCPIATKEAPCRNGKCDGKKRCIDPGGNAIQKANGRCCRSDLVKQDPPGSTSFKSVPPRFFYLEKNDNEKVLKLKPKESLININDKESSLDLKLFGLEVNNDRNTISPLMPLHRLKTKGDTTPKELKYCKTTFSSDFIIIDFSKLKSNKTQLKDLKLTLEDEQNICWPEKDNLKLCFYDILHQEITDADWLKNDHLHRFMFYDSQKKCIDDTNKRIESPEVTRILDCKGIVAINEDLTCERIYFENTVLEAIHKADNFFQEVE